MWTKQLLDRLRHRGLRPTLRLRLLLVIFPAAALAMSVAVAQPFVPTDDATVLERVPVSSGSDRRELRAMRESLASSPQDHDLAAALAHRYIALGRAEADPRYNGWAQAVLQPWWEMAEPPIDVLVLRATILQNRHEFGAALRDLDRALARAPRNAQAWLTKATILRVQGKPREAAASCASLFGSTDALTAITCLADATSLAGKAQASYARLSEAFSAQAEHVEPVRRLWTLTVLGEIAGRLGDAASADGHFREAVSLGVRDIYLSAACADELLDQGRAADARAFLAGQTAADTLLLRLAIAEKRLADREAEKHEQMLQARIDAARARGDRLHLREEARFTLELLGDPPAALRLAEENWRVQREPADARIMLEAALAAALPASARPVLAWLDETGLEDVRLGSLADKLREPAT
jgi:tetratricopeptide (TPR) repeat protein